MVIVLSDSEVETALDLKSLVDVVGEALQKQAAGAVERPDRPHFPVGAGLDGPDPEGMGITMSAYIHGAEYYVTKLVGVHEDNVERGLPTINAQVVLTDAETGLPVALMGGTTLTNARTGCVGALSVQTFAPETETLGVIGAGAQARWQTRAIATVADLADVRISAPSESRQACATDLQARDIPARAVDSAREAVDGADTVVTATTATAPVFPAEALASTALVVAVGAYTAEMQELAPAVLEGAETIYADVPAEVAETGDLRAAAVESSELASLGAALADEKLKRGNGVTVVDSVGSATLDAAVAPVLYRRARASSSGTEISL